MYQRPGAPLLSHYARAKIYQVISQGVAWSGTRRGIKMTFLRRTTGVSWKARIGKTTLTGEDQDLTAAIDSIEGLRRSAEAKR